MPLGTATFFALDNQLVPEAMLLDAACIKRLLPKS
jgi:hypothetical protein